VSAFFCDYIFKLIVNIAMLTWRQLLEDPTQHRKLFESTYKAHHGPTYTSLDPFPIASKHLQVPITYGRIRSYGLLYHAQTQPPSSQLGVHTYPEGHELIQYLNSLHNKRYGFLNLQTLPPREGTPMHYDTNRFALLRLVEFYPEDICKIFIFAEDWVDGQTIWLGDTMLTGWKRFECVRFPWYMPHRTVNSSGVPRTMFHYIGV